MAICYRSLVHDGAFEPLGARVMLNITLPLVTMQITDSVVAEEGPDQGAILLHRTGILDQPLFVLFQIQQPSPPTQHGVATNGIDYIGLSSIVRIPAGRRTVTIPIIPIDDLEVEGGEVVRFTILDSAEYRLDMANPLNRIGTVVILEDDAQPLVTIDAPDFLAAEIGGADVSAVDTARFVIRRTGDRALPLTVTYRIRGSATNGGDYESIQRSIVIPAGRLAAAVTIRPINDALFEGDETVRIILQPSTNGSYGLNADNPSDVSSHITLLDKPLVSLLVTDPFGTQFPQDTASFTLLRTGPTDRPLQVLYTLGGTGIVGQDYRRLPQVLTIPAGQTTLLVPIRGLGNQQTGPRTVRLTLGLANTYNLNLSQPMLLTVSNFVTLLDEPAEQ